LKWLVSTALLEVGSIARSEHISQSKMLMRGIKGIYLEGLLQFHRHHTGLARIILPVVHRNLLVAP
jgi:hypothetical protein